MTVTIDGAGRIVIPKAIREREGLTAGTELEIRVENGKIELEVPCARLEWRNGLPVLVAPPGAPVITNAMVNEWIEQDRNARGLIDEPVVGQRPAPAVAGTPTAIKRRRAAGRRPGGAASKSGRAAS